MEKNLWKKAIAAGEIGLGEMRSVEIGGVNVAIYNVEGRFYATSNICTHEVAFLTEGWLEGKVIECPLHAGQFDVTTGKGLCAPINCDLQTYAVRIVDQDIQVCLDAVTFD
ncbi:naphthalene 1,2-dioxygenase system ferredoxin subunit [Paraburkholderia xenovorans LB400]|nr:non-heme iron oxygenase ferredoxin subunit [Paraburkholderia xenovorans]AIP35029.1 naphthalene 1,2-dioxygenase system ferredoxin subunit [Paraburkholderia xenovorans LB400]